MSPLSPAAKAVISKIADRDCIDRGEFYYRQVGAAALRAAVDQTNPKLHIEDIDYQHQLYVDGWKDALDVILDIAAELDGGNG
jgi:hypothetical protein